MGEELLDSLAAVEAALADLAKRVQDAAWQLSDTEAVELTRRLHAVTSKAQGLGVQMIRELDTRGVPATMDAPSLRAFVSGALRLSPREAGRLTRLAATLGQDCSATATALADGAVNFEQAGAIAKVVRGLPSIATAEQRTWAEEFLLEQAKVLNAEDLGLLSKRIDDAIDPDGNLPRDKVAAERRAANIRNHHDGTQTLTWRDTDEVIAELKAAMTALDAPRPGENGDPDPRTPQI